MKTLLIIVIFFHASVQVPDSSKLYYKKYIFWQTKFNNELNRLNKFRKPTITQRLLDYQDSTIRYKLLLNRLKK